MNTTLAPSLVRTLVPMIVGWALSIPAAGPVEHALGVNAGSAGRILTAALTALLGFVYYTVVRYAEHHRQIFGWLLGLAARPVAYEAPAGKHDTAADVAAGNGLAMLGPDGAPMATSGKHSAP